MGVLANRPAALQSRKGLVHLADLIGARRHLSLGLSGGAIAGIAILDRVFPQYSSFGSLYLVPLSIIGTLVSPLRYIGVSLACAVLREALAPFAWGEGFVVRLLFVWFAFAAVGLLTSRMYQDRRHAIERAENARREQELSERCSRGLDDVLEASPVALLAVDEAGGIVSANSAAARILTGTSDGRVYIGTHCRHWSGRLAEWSMAAAAGKSFPERAECIGRRDNGQSFSATVWLARSQSGPSPLVVAALWDDTEVIRSGWGTDEHPYTRVARVVAGALAHEVKNIAATLDAIQANLARHPNLAGDADYRALGAVVEMLRTIGSQGRLPAGPGTGETVDLRGLLEKLANLVEPVLQRVPISLEWDPAVPLPVRADGQAVMHIFLNLLRNAERALAGRPDGRIIVEVVPDSARVAITISDNGSGVERPDLLFRPFSGPSGSLGLFVSRSLAQACGGDLRYSAGDPGSRFTVLLPLGGAEERRAEGQVA